MTNSQIRVGTAPDSWGVWFPDDPGQIPWERFLDEVQAAGYHWIELGPFGYLPTDPARLGDELAKRDLQLSAGTVFTGFHKDDDQWERAWTQALDVAGLVAQLGVEHLVVIPDLWRSDSTAQVLEERTLSDHQWSKLADGHDRLGKALWEEFGIRQQFHSHADSHVGTYREVERFLQETNPQFTNLCLDTGHFAYYLGDNVRLMEAYPERIGYLHLKQVEPDILAHTLKNDLPFVEAVGLGVMCEPGTTGIPEFAPIIEKAAGINPEMFAIVEQDMYGCEIDFPFPIAKRTREHIFSCTAAARIK
jgi:inosose dehydratase